MVTISKEQTLVLCNICMVDYDLKQVQKIKICNCLYCKECLFEYLKFEIMVGAYDITCPDAACPKKGIFDLLEIEDIVGKELFEKHIEFRLNVDISLDSKRVWCPKPDCNTVVKTTGLKTNFLCGKCKFEFCSLCLDAWHSTLSCEDYGKCSRVLNKLVSCLSTKNLTP